MTRRTVKFIVHVLGTLVGVASVLLAGAAWRLSQGPIELAALAPYVEAALSQQGFGYRFEVGSAELAWGNWERAFDLRMLDVEVTHDDGTPAFSAHEVLLEMALPPLVRGELRPRSITVIRPSISGARDADGKWSFALMASSPAVPSPTGAGGEALAGTDLIDAFLAARNTPPFEYLEEVSVVGADLWIDDRVLGLQWNAPAAELTLARHGNGLELSGRMALHADDHKLNLDLVALYQPAANTTLVSLRLADFALSDLPMLVPRLPSLDGLDLHVDGELTLAFNGSFGITGGSFSLQAERGAIDMAQVFAGPIELGPSRMTGHIRPGFAGIEITELDLGLGIERSTARLTLDGWTPDATLDVRIDIEGLPLDDLDRYWPVKLVPRARTWLVDHVSEGRVTRGSLAFSATVAELAESRLPLANLVVDMDVEQARVEYLDGLPPVTGVDGHVVIADDALRIDSTTGALNGLTASRGLLTMDGLDGRNGMLVGAEAAGEISPALEVVTNERLAMAALVDIDPAAVSGTIDGRLEIFLPKLVGLTTHDVKFRLAADLHDLALTADLRGYRVDGGEGTLVFDSATAVFDGSLRLNDVPFDVAYHQSFRLEEEVRRTIELRGHVTETDRRRLGIPDLIDMDGPLDVVLDLTQTDAGKMIWSAAVDLAPARVFYPLLAIDKPIGAPGRALLRLVDEHGAMLRLENVDIEIADTRITGHGALHADALTLARLDLDRLQFGRNDLTGALSVRPDGMFDVTLTGGTADLEPLLDDLTSSAGPTLPPFTISGTLDGIWLTDNDAVSGVKIDGSYQGDHWESLAVTGTLAEATPMSLSIWRFSPEERRFEYTAGDAGDAIRAVGLFDNAAGGNLEIRARIDDSDPDRPSAGAMRATDFTLTQAPILAQILSIASLTGIANALTGEGLAFDEALIPFQKRGDLVTLKDARAYGPGLGITIFGTVDLGSDDLSLDGTIVPLYEINSALGEIPLIGDLLTGFEEGGGLFGFTYEVRGPREDPQVSVDPLSLLTPGFLRRIFSAPSDAEIQDYSFDSSRTEGGR